MKDSSEPKKLWRSRTDKRIAGVCGGLGEYFRMDSVLIRIIFVIFFLAGGAAFIAYVIIWLLVPLEPLSTTKSPIIHDNKDGPL